MRGTGAAMMAGEIVRLLAERKLLFLGTSLVPRNLDPPAVTQLRRPAAPPSAALKHLVPGMFPAALCFFIAERARDAMLL